MKKVVFYMQKKGSTHVEFIISMILFIGVVFFSIYLANPVTQKNSDSLVSITANSIRNNVETESATYSVKIKKENVPFSSGTIAFDSSDVGLSGGCLAFDSSEIKMSCARSADDNVAYFSWNGQEFIYLIFSDEITRNQPTEQTSIDTNLYETASVVRDKVYSESKLLSLADRYNKDYSSLKTSLGFPSGRDFVFSIKLNDTSRIAVEREELGNSEVYSKTERLEVISEGGIKFVDFDVKIW